MAVEVEARFRAEDPATLARLANVGGLGKAELGPAATVDETDAYLDTEDGALAAAGWACRLRRRGERRTISLKGPPERASGGWLHRRPEIEGPATDERVPEAWPAGRARDALDRLRDGRPLVERLALDQRRTERAVGVAGRRIGVLSLDEVRATHAGRPLGTFHIVELELDDAAGAGPDILAALAADLGRLPGLVPEPRSKLERALELLRPA